MKFSYILLLSYFFFSSPLGFAQKDWNKFIRENPRTALQESQKMYAVAQKEKNIPASIQAFILQLRCKTLINPASYPQILKEIEDKITQTEHIVEKSILHSWLSQLYREYYTTNAYRINQRTPLQNYIPEDVNEWSANLFIQKSFQHALAALQNKTTLQQTPVQSYRLILTTGKNSCSLRPTLYDFLCHRSIRELITLYPYIENYFRQEPADTSFALSPLPRFLQDTTHVYPLDVKSNILNIYQNLLLFRQSERNDSSALLIAELERLNYAREITGMESTYHAILQKLGQEFSAIPHVIEVMYNEANYYLSKADEKPGNCDFRTQALQIAKSGIKKFPHYERIGLLKKIIQTIETPQLNITLNDNIYPGNNLELKTRYYHIGEIQISLYKINETSNNYKYKIQDSLSYDKSLILQKKITFPRNLAYRDTTLSIAIPQSGLYEITITSSKNKSITKTFICSELHTAIQQFVNRFDFVVREAFSGKPVKEAQIHIFTHTNRFPYKKYTTLTTDQQGLAHFSLPRSLHHFIYEVTNSRNPNNQLIYQYFYNEQKPIQKTGIALFTDRKIYRPGQPVYYNGISWQTNTDSSQVNTNKTFTVALYDANSRKIKEEQLTTNSWGSFSGSFIIPQKTLNGQFSIRTTNGRTNFTVAEYKRPSVEILINPINQACQPGDSIRIEGTVKNYSGITLPHSKITYQISLNSWLRWQSPSKIIEKGETVTNTNGNFHIHFKSQQTETFPTHAYRGYYYEINIQTTDSKGESQHISTNIPAGPATYRTEINIPEKINKTLPAIIQLRTFNPNDEKTAKNIEYKICKLAPLKHLGTTYHTDSLIIEKEIISGRFNTEKDSLILHFNDYESGAYVFQIISPEVPQKTPEEKAIFYLYSPADKRPPLLTYNWFIPQKTTCLPGENAEIILGTSAKDIYVLYEIYTHQGIAEQKLLKLSDEIKTLSIPYKKEYGNNISLSLSYVKDHQFFSNELLIHKQKPNPVLNLTTKIFRNKLIPGQQEEWTFQLTDAQGRPVKGEIMAVMYDRTLDRFIPNRWIFFPQPYLTPLYPHWEANQSTQKQYVWFNFYRRSPQIPSFQFDRLNTYGMEHPSDLIECSSIISTRYANQNIMKDEAADGLLEKKAAIGAFSSRLPIEIRTDFAETAFFYPQTVTNPEGMITLKFTVPEAITGWKFMAVAHTQELRYAHLQKEITTFKYLTIQPNLPRFFRSGDSTVVQATILNQSPTLQEGTAQLELFNTSTGKTILIRKTNFKIEAEQNSSLAFGFYVPQNLSVVGCRITARTNTFSDGEQHSIAVAPDKLALTKALPIFSSQKGNHSYTLSDDNKTQQDYQLTIEMTANPIWYAVLALPNLQSPQTENIIQLAAAYYVNAMASSIARFNPKIATALQTWQTDNTSTLFSQLEQNNELKSLLLQVSPWANEAQDETEQIQALQQLFNQNRLNHLQSKLLLNIRQLQNENGGWGWFKGMVSDRFITSNILTILSHVGILGQYESDENEKMIQIKALNYLDEEIKKDFARRTKEPQISYKQILYLYTRSQYRDIPLAEALEAHKYYMNLAEKQWSEFGLYEKALMISVFHRYGKKETAAQLLHSLKEYATISPDQGMFWPSNLSQGTSINSPLLTHVAIMEAFHETEGNTPATELMKQWLLRQKQTQNWGNVPSTVNAIYALLLTGTPLLDKQEHLTIALGDHKLPQTDTNNILGYLKASFPAPQITSSMKTAVLTKSTDSPSWGGLYLQYFEKLEQIRKSLNTSLNIEKKLFIEKNTDTGKKLIPLTTSLHPGDKIIVRLTINADRDFQYVHLKDLRAACFEPVNQTSGPKWKYGLSYYEETKDTGTHIFFTYLPKGTYVFEYAVWVNQTGIYQDGIATLQCLYAPAFVSHSETQKINVQ